MTESGPVDTKNGKIANGGRFHIHERRMGQSVGLR